MLVTQNIKKMKTKCGTCNSKDKRIWLNLELAKKPFHCIDYVFVHELVHLKERKHSDRFIQLLESAYPKWKQSNGEKIDSIHFRNGHLHAVCDPRTGLCEIHYDEIDPMESTLSLVKHMSQSNIGKAVLVTGAGLLLDQLLTGGKVRKSISKSLLG